MTVGAGSQRLQLDYKGTSYTRLVCTPEFVVCDANPDTACDTTF